MSYQSEAALLDLHLHVNILSSFTLFFLNHLIQISIYIYKGIIAKQFRDLKFGDRFYYENGELNSYRLTVDQLDSIRKSNMARILCDNLDIDFIQLNPFRPPDRQLNPLISCKRIQRVSLRPWKIYTY